METNPAITLLRSLHDLDLGAFAYNTRIAGERLTPADLDVLCAAYTAQPSGYRAVLIATLGHKAAPAQGARELAALGAKVRAALPTDPNPQATHGRKLGRGEDNHTGRLMAAIQSARQALAEMRGDQVSTAPLADQIRALPRLTAPAKPGDVVPGVEVEDGALYWDAQCSRMPFRMVVPEGSLLQTGPGDPDIERALQGDITGGPSREHMRTSRGTPMILVARDLGTDPEAWRRAMCEWTENGNKPAAPNEDGCNLSYDEQRKRANDWRDEATIAIKRYKTAEAALKTAVELVEQVTKERDEHAATAARRLETLHEADERDTKVREALGDVDFESTEGAVIRIMKQHELDLKAATFEIKHLRDERDVARAQVDSLRRHSDPDRPPSH